MILPDDSNPEVYSANSSLLQVHPLTFPIFSEIVFLAFKFATVTPLYFKIRYCEKEGRWIGAGVAEEKEVSAPPSTTNSEQQLETKGLQAVRKSGGETIMFSCNQGMKWCRKKSRDEGAVNETTSQKTV